MHHEYNKNARVCNAREYNDDDTKHYIDDDTYMIYDGARTHLVAQ
jgi:hypothetical protein